LTDALSGIAGQLTRILPRAEFLGRGVAFEQRIVVARKGVEPLGDVRRGARLRVECRLPGTTATAVAERVLPARGGDHASDWGAFAEELARRAEALHDARELPHRELPVLLAPGVGGVLVHEIVGHALEADRVLEGDSWLAQFEERVAASELLVIDDPRRGRAPWRVDDEGELSKPTPLLRDGRVAGWLHDVQTASATGKPTTGHGRCSSFRDPVQPRMGCTFVAPGECEPAELLDAVRDGVYVRRMEAGTTDPRTGRAVFRVTDADRIRGGKIDAPLQPHLLFIDGARVLTDANRIANDLAFDSCVGSCHRDGRPLSVSVGAPTMWIGPSGVSVRENSTCVSS
jgi:TldD protein